MKIYAPNIHLFAFQLYKISNKYTLPPFNRQGELFGSPIFEYGLFSQLANYQHVLIWLFTDEQAERDRALENTIQILGIGFGGGAIVSGVVIQHIDKISQPLAAISPDNQPHPFYASLLLSILATLFFIGLGWLITKRK